MTGIGSDPSANADAQATGSRAAPHGGSVLYSLQLGRAVAALMVLLYHAGSADYQRPGMPPFIGTPLSYGYLGVDFFFVLSGFIIYHTNRNDTPSPAWTRRYATSRLIRIFIPYLPVGIALALAYTLMPNLSAGDRAWGWVATLTLLPTDVQPALLVAWTLQHELLFYAIFWISFRLGRPILGVALWAAAAAVWTIAQFDQSLPLAYFFGLINVEFLFGVLAARLIDSRSASAWFWAGAAAAMMAYMLAGPELEYRILFALAAALALVPIVRNERRGIMAGRRFARLFGDSSYAIYLVHLPLIALLSRFAPGHWAAALLLFAFAGAVAGLIYYHLYEKPALRLVRTWLGRSKRRESVPGASGDGLDRDKMIQ